MLCVFGRQRIDVASPTKKHKSACQSLSPEEEDYVFSHLENLYNSLPRRQRAYVTEHIFGGGANGIAFLDATQHSLATDHGVSVFFTGNLQDADSEARHVLTQYTESWQHSDVAGAAEELAKLRGSWAFILFDRSLNRIVAARDSKGKEPLYWGTACLGEGLLFSTDKALIEGECADVDHFPPGSLFVSENGDTKGFLTSLSGGSSTASLDELALEATSYPKPLIKVASHP